MPKGKCRVLLKFTVRQKTGAHLFLGRWSLSFCFYCYFLHSFSDKCRARSCANFQLLPTRNSSSFLNLWIAMHETWHSQFCIIEYNTYHIIILIYFSSLLQQCTLFQQVDINAVFGCIINTVTALIFF